MPNDAFTDAIKEAFASCPSNLVTYHTLEVRQNGVQDPVFLVQARRSLTANDENGVLRSFRPAGFQFSLPPVTQDGFTSLNVSIDNIGQEVTDFVKTAKASSVPVECIYRPYLSTDLTQPQMNPPLLLYLKDLQIQQFQVVGRATFMDIVNKKYPAELYTRGRFPALG